VHTIAVFARYFQTLFSFFTRIKHFVVVLDQANVVGCCDEFHHLYLLPLKQNLKFEEQFGLLMLEDVLYLVAAHL